MLRYPLLEDVGQSDWRSVSVGGDHTCGLKSDGTAYCWGSNKYGQLGVSAKDTVCGTKPGQYPCSIRPRAVETSAKFLSISAGQNHTCGVTTAREAYCWGLNDQGQLGSLTEGGPTPARVDAQLPWVQISAGFSHSCGIRSDGALACWGQNDRGQIGVGTLLNTPIPSRVTLLPEAATDVSASQARSCARTISNKVYCWGAIWTNTENGLEFTRTQTVPQLVPGAPGMVSLSVGALTTCGTDAVGVGYCWEANPRGQRGDGTFNGSTTPLPVKGAIRFAQMSAGIVQTCAIATNGAGYCWGDDSFGQLGVAPSTIIERCGGGTLLCTSTPVAVIGRQSFVEISTGLGSHTCGVTTQGNLYCWGLGQSGQRGDGSMAIGVYTPAKVVPPTK